MSRVEFRRLYEIARPDPYKAAGGLNKKGEIVTVEKQRGHAARRLRGFLFTVDGKPRWQEDPDALVAIGLWIAAYEKIAFEKSYVTTRAHGGFAIYFRMEKDAVTLREQCLRNANVFSGKDALMNGCVPKKRSATQQLPGIADRSLSSPFAPSLHDRLHIWLPSPLSSKPILVRLGGVNA
jgi:hypothetical protein